MKCEQSYEVKYEVKKELLNHYICLMVITSYDNGAVKRP